MKTKSNYGCSDSFNLSQTNSDNQSMKFILFYIAFSFIIFLLFETTIVLIGIYFIPSKLVIVISLVIINGYLLRTAFILLIFLGKNKCITFFRLLIQARTEMRKYLEILSSTSYELKQLTSIINIHHDNRYFHIDQGYHLIQFINNIFEVIKQKYGLKSYSQEIGKQIKLTYDLFTKSKIVLILNSKKHNSDQFITELHQSDKNTIHSIIKEMNILIELFRNKILQYDFTFNIFKLLMNSLSNDLFLTKEYFRVKTIMYYHFTEFFINSKDNTQIDCVLLFKEQSHVKQDKKSLMIICLPNFTMLEQFIESWDLNSLYLFNNIDVLLWSYRGYGFSEGSVTLNNIQTDIESIYDFMKKSNRWNKIGVHGISIGGIPACHLANKKAIDVLIADRTFSSLDTLYLSLSCGKLIYIISKLLCIRSESNTCNYLQSKCTKIILYDPNDSTIPLSSSLITSISEHLIKAISKKSNFLIESVMCQSQQNMFYTSLHKFFYFMNNYQQNKKNAEKDREDQDLSLSLISINLNQIKFIDSFYNRIKYIFLGLESIGMLLDNLIDCKDLKQFINIFFNNFAIWGSSNNLCTASTDKIELSLQYVVDGLTDLIQKKEFEKLNHYKMSKEVSHFINGIQSIIEYFKKINIKEKHRLVSKQKGSLIILSCGHNSSYRENEIECFNNILKPLFN